MTIIAAIILGLAFLDALIHRCEELDAIMHEALADIDRERTER